MSDPIDLVGLITQAANAAEEAATKAEREATLAVAYFRPEAENLAIARNAINAVTAPEPNYRAIMAAETLAAFAVISEQDRAEFESELAALRAENYRFDKAFSIQTFRRSLKPLIESVQRARESATAREKFIIDPRAPMATARLIHEITAKSRFPTFHRFAGNWWSWTGQSYSLTTNESMEAIVWNILEKAYVEGGNNKTVLFKPYSKFVNDVMNALTAIAQVGSKTAPCWLADEDNMPKADDLIAYENGLMSIEAYLSDDQATLIPHLPTFFNQTVLPYPRRPGAACALWLAFLNEIFEGDPRRIVALQLYMGYLLTADTSLHIILLLIGASRSGKGVVLRIITALLGKQNVAGSKLADLGGQFGLYPLVGKSFVTCGDVHSVGKNASEVVEILLGLAGEDLINIDRKHRDPLTDVKITARVALTMNELVNLPNNSGALANRIRVIPFEKSFKDKEDPDLTEKLIAELPGIAEWALSGLKALRQAKKSAIDQGKPVGEVMRKLLQPPAGQRYLDHFQRMTSPIAAFLDEKCLIEPGRSVREDELFESWVNWCQDNGHRETAKATFYSKLLGIHSSIVQTRPTLGGIRQFVLQGITLNSHLTREKNQEYLNSLNEKEVIKSPTVK